MKQKVLALVLCLCASTAVQADSWTFKDDVRTWRFSNLKVEAITDALRDGSAHQYVRITKGSKVLAMLNGVGFETLIESPDKRLFVGLSNSGLPGTAAVVFDHEGRLMLYASHGASNLAYCRASVTIDRTWFDAANPDVQFEPGGVITLNDCEGKRVNLVETLWQGLSPPRSPGG